MGITWIILHDMEACVYQHLQDCTVWLRYGVLFKRLPSKCCHGLGKVIQLPQTHTDKVRSLNYCLGIFLIAHYIEPSVTGTEPARNCYSNISGTTL